MSFKNSCLKVFDKCKTLDWLSFGLVQFSRCWKAQAVCQTGYMHAISCSLMLSLLCSDRLSVPVRRDIESPALTNTPQKHLTPLNSPQNGFMHLRHGVWLVSSVWAPDSLLQEKWLSNKGSVSTDALTALITCSYVSVCARVDVFGVGYIFPWCLVSSAFPPFPSLSCPLHTTPSLLPLFSFCTRGLSVNPACITLSAPLFVLILCSSAPLSPNICFH